MGTDTNFCKIGCAIPVIEYLITFKLQLRYGYSNCEPGAVYVGDLLHACDAVVDYIKGESCINRDFVC